MTDARRPHHVAVFVGLSAGAYALSLAAVTALVRALAAAGVSAISMEMIPRSTIAQKMDALTSQANVAGYKAVLIAAMAESSGECLPNE